MGPRIVLDDPSSRRPGRTGVRVERLIGEPAVSAPSVGAPSVGAPSVGAPSVGAPSVGAPSVGAPSVGAPSVGAPSVGAPSVGAPSVGEPRLGTWTGHLCLARGRVVEVDAGGARGSERVEDRFQLRPGLRGQPELAPVGAVAGVAAPEEPPILLD